MSEIYLLQALVLFDRMGDPDCSEFEHYEIDREIQRIRWFMTGYDEGYFDAIRDLCILRETL